MSQREIKFLGTYMGKKMYGNDVTAECLEWHAKSVGYLERERGKSEMKSFELEVLRGRGFWKRLFNFYK